MANYQDAPAAHTVGGVSITINAVAYFAENATETEDSDQIFIQGANDEYVGQNLVSKPKTLTATLIAAAGATPTIHTEFTYNSTTYVLQTITNTLSTGSVEKIDITASEKIN